MSARDALLKYSQKQLNKARTNKRRNKKPEEIAVKDICQWCEKYGWQIHRVESKAVYSPSARRYLRGQTEAGFPDLVGNTKRGQSVYIEVKAKGKRSTLKPHQREFLVSKIKSGCFAVCADSDVYVNDTWVMYCRIDDEELRRKFLLENLPKSRS